MVFGYLRCHLSYQLKIRQLCDRDFDITAMDGLEKGQSEGHAFQFIHRRLLDGSPGGNAGTLPVIPIVLNTFDPPNQPTRKRCVALMAWLGIGSAG